MKKERKKVKDNIVNVATKFEWNQKIRNHKKQKSMEDDMKRVNVRNLTTA